MKKVLTVSIAAYNVEKYIEECLMPFYNKKIVDDLEIFIIDDGGTDNTMKIAKKYADEYPDTFKLIHKKNGGWGSTVNYGIEHATGKYFKQLDGDDYFLNTSLEKYLELLKNSDVDLIYTPFTTFRDGNNSVVEKNGNITGYKKNVSYNVNELIQNIPLNMHSCTFKTDVLKKDVKILEHCFYTDVEYIIKGMSHIKTILFSDIEVYQYRVARSGQSMSIEGLRKHYKEHKKVLVTLLDYVQDEKIVDTLNIMFKKRLAEMITMQYMIYLYLNPDKEHKKEIIDFDKLIKEQYDQMYSCDVKSINILRKTHFLFYKMLAKRAQKKFN